ncbi:MAG: efflux RND transporter periplasmic adaptor subunit [Gimesia chilikensis]|uniref:efflux RND transporter periplasmic adaptor subunit n=1 Tax=Gimesia chilikensis TaxID=2605989 RepID=UPI0037ABBC0D
MATAPNTIQRMKSPSKHRYLGWGILWMVVASVVIVVARLWLFPPSAPPPLPRTLPPSVSGLGRLAPKTDVIRIAPPTPTGAMSGARVEKLLVAVGDEVQTDQVVAILDTHRGRVASIGQFKAMIAVAQAKLALVKAGPKPEDIRVQEALIRHARANLANAEANYRRAEKLVGSNAISQEDYETRELNIDQARTSLEQEQARLEALKAIRPEDVQAAEAELAQAEASLEIAKEDLRNTEVRSPISGEILRIHARAGERIGDAGLLDVGDTSVMDVVAEVYEGDIAQVRIGQHAKVRVPTLGEDLWLAGEVVCKDLVVARQDLFDNDPVADIDSRIVEVRIRLSAEDSVKVAGLANARAEFVIDVSGEMP